MTSLKDKKMKLSIMAVLVSSAGVAFAAPPANVERAAPAAGVAASVAEPSVEDVLAMQSRVDAVTIFQSRGLVVRRADHRVGSAQRGDLLRMRVLGLPASLDEESVQARCGGAAKPTVVGVALEGVAPEVPFETPDVSALQKELGEHQEKLRLLQDGYTALEERRAFQQRMRDYYIARFGKQDDEIDLKQWAEVQKHHAEAVAILMRERHALDRDKRVVEAQVAEVQQKLAKVNEAAQKAHKPAPRTRALQMDVRAARAGKMTCFVRYMVSGVAWRSSYDARLDDGALKLSHFGMLTNRSGEDWTNTRVSVSTVDPGQLLALPTLSAHVLSVYTPRPYHGRWNQAPAMKVARESAGQVAAAPTAPAGPAMDDHVAMAAPEVAQLSERLQHVVFTSPSRATVPSNGVPRKVVLAEHGYEPQLTYLAIPRVSDGAFLTAKVKHGGSAPLLPGALRIFLGDDFVGHAQLRHTVPGDDVTFSFGRDDRVKLTRVRLHRERKDVGVFTKETVTREAWRIRVKSLVPRAIQVAVLDAAPVTSDKRIHVELEPDSMPRAPVLATDPPGTLRWKLALERTGEAELTFGWQIRHPRGLPVAGL